jgi:hypothetical protein
VSEPAATRSVEVRRARLRAQTRLIAACLEGIAAVGFICVLLRDQITAMPLSFWRSEGVWLACAFFAAAAITYLLWPWFDDQSGMSRWRAALCGLAVVLPATVLWLLLIGLASVVFGKGQSWAGAGNTIVAGIMLVLVFGWALFPLAGCTAMIAAAWGDARLRRA